MTGRIRTLYVALLSLLLLLVPAWATAGTLNALVLGNAANPKSYVRVELYGPENRTTFTDPDGRFSLRLRAGRYIIHVIDEGRRMECTVDVPGGDRDHPATLRLRW